MKDNSLTLIKGGVGIVKDICPTLAFSLFARKEYSVFSVPTLRSLCPAFKGVEFMEPLAFLFPPDFN